MRHRGELVRALALAAALLPGLATPAAEADRTQWKLASFTWVNRVAAEPGAPANDHPAQVSREAIQMALGPVVAQVDGSDTPLFEAKELAALAKALEEAFAVVKPSEDLVLLSTQRRGGHFMDPAFGVTARVFVKGGALNLIVHDARLDFMDRYSADRTLPTFAYGSRKAASAVSLRGPGAALVRPDWLAIPLAVASAAPAPAPAPALGQAQAPSAPTPAPTAEAPKRDQDFYDQQYQRLKALKRMRDENLITEAEYQQKREAILKTL
ncbi:SHOCT domain-containing protein [Geothrix sp. SG200]|uniref:SHOCT domain-containing protein n=1 Tax=Geothrix sp. SG200 TaxID=2922865 RepID=UPI001FACAD98|nr:SHOCT domain-containing protein [Geothrix sp. SG200]